MLKSYFNPSTFPFTLREISLIFFLVLYSTWLFSMSYGLYVNSPSLVDYYGHPLGADFVQYYAAGKTILEGKGNYLYDIEYQHLLQLSLVNGEFIGYYNFNYPPFVAFLYAPLSVLSYEFAYMVWILVQITLIFFCLKYFKCNHSSGWLYFLIYFPIFSSLSYGQNGIMTLSLFVLFLNLSERKKLFYSGIILSLLVYKPQLLMGIVPILLLSGLRSIKILLGLFIGVMLIVVIHYTFLFEMSSLFLIHLNSAVKDISSLTSFPFIKSYSLKVFYENFFNLKEFSLILWIATCLILILLFIRRKPKTKNFDKILISQGIILTPFIAPYFMVYDLTISLVVFFILKNEFVTVSDKLVKLAIVINLAMISTIFLDTMKIPLGQLLIFSTYLYLFYLTLTSLPEKGIEN